MNTLTLGLIALGWLAVPAPVARTPAPLGQPDLSLRNELQHAIDRGLSWLQGAQNHHTMAQALQVRGVRELELANGQKVDWRQDLAKKLLNLQQRDGSWFNPTNRWWERKRPRPSPPPTSCWHLGM